MHPWKPPGTLSAARRGANQTGSLTILPAPCSSSTSQKVAVGHSQMICKGGSQGDLRRWGEQWLQMEALGTGKERGWGRRALRKSCIGVLRVGLVLRPPELINVRKYPGSMSGVKDRNRADVLSAGHSFFVLPWRSGWLGCFKDPCLGPHPDTCCHGCIAPLAS